MHYHTYIDSSTSAGSTTISGISTRGSEYGVGISSDIQTANFQCSGICTVGLGTTSPTQFYVFGTTVISGVTTVGLGTTSSPENSQLSFDLTSDTNLRISVRGSDGILRFANITLA